MQVPIDRRDDRSILDRGSLDPQHALQVIPDRYQLGVHQLNYVVSVSEGHNMSNVRRTTQESLDDLKRIAEFLKTIEAGKRPKLFCGLATSFGCTIEGIVPHDRVVMIAEQVAAIGVDEIGLADTVGFGNPAAVRALFTSTQSPIYRERADVTAAQFWDRSGWCRGHPEYLPKPWRRREARPRRATAPPSANRPAGRRR